MSPSFYSRATIIVIVLNLVIFSFIIRGRDGFKARTGHDVHFMYADAYSLSQGENPYARIAGQGMVKNHKYYLYTPGFLVLTAGLIRLGFDSFADWQEVWLWLSLVSYFGVGWLLYLLVARSGQPALGLLAALIWVFNRWSFYVLRVGQIDILGIFFLVLSILLFKRQRCWSFLALGLSLGIKQVAVFLVPIYMIWVWNEAPKGLRLRRSLEGLGLIAIIPILLSIPFLIWDWNSYLRSLLFPVTRQASSHGSLISVDAAIGLIGLDAKLFFGSCLMLIYFLAYKNILRPYGAALLTLFTFASMHSVFFFQYVSWMVPFMVLSLTESTSSTNQAPARG